MTGIDATTHRVADIRTSANRAAAEPSEQQATAEQLVVDTRRGARTTARIMGAVGVVAGAAIGGAMLLRGRPTPGAFPSIANRAPMILAGALAGAGLLGIGAAQLIKPRTVDALVANIDTPEDARARAATLGGNLTVVRAADGTFAIVPGDAQLLDAHSADHPALPASVGQLGVNSYVTRHGDVLERTGTSSAEQVPFTNTGLATGAIDLDSISVDPTHGPGAALTGTRLGLDIGGSVTRLGTPIGERTGYDSPEVAARELFEAGTDSSALVTIGGRTFAFQVDGNIGSTTAKGSELRQLGALRIQSGDQLQAFPQAGEGLDAAGQAATHDLASMEPGAVTGLRLGTVDGTVVRIGTPVVDAAGYGDMGQAGLAAHLADEQGSHAILALGDRGYAFTIDGLPAGATPSAIDLSSLLPGDRAGIQAGEAILRGGANGELLTSALPATDLDDPATTPQSIIGRRLGTDAAGAEVRIGAIVGDAAGYDSSKAAAVGALAADPGATHAIIKVGGRHYAFGSEGGFLAQATKLLAPPSNISGQSGPKLYGTTASGAVGFVARITPFDTNEPIGRTLGGNAPGAPERLIGSFGSSSAGRSAIKDSSLVDAVFRGDTRGAALIGATAADGNVSHLYELGGGGSGGWDHQMGSVDAVLRQTFSRWGDQREEGTNQLYDYVYSQTKAVLDDSGGTSTLKDSGVVQESRSYNASASDSLRRRREEEARQRELERQREIERQRELERQREIERQRQAELDRQREIERQRQAEIDRQRAQEQARQDQIDRQRQAEIDRQRDAERARDAERQREAERQRATERQRDSSSNGNAGWGSGGSSSGSSSSGNSSSNGNADW